MTRPAEVECPSLEEALSRLESEANPGYVYRGQPACHGHLLYPSIYRGTLENLGPCTFELDARLRGIGKLFLPLGAVPDTPDGMKTHRRMKTVTWLNHLFGYPFAQVLAQQFGLRSEGLDVTRNPDIAAFFAIHNGEHLNPIEVSAERGVIYRFPVSTATLTLTELEQQRLFDCPTYLDAASVLDLFDTCSTGTEIIESLFEYKVAMALMDLTQPIVRRPLHLIKMTEAARQSCRLARQKAGLLIGDMLLTEWYGSASPELPARLASRRGLPAIENIAYREGVTCFTFPHARSNSQLVTVKREDLFPVDDMLGVALVSFIHPRLVGVPFFVTPFGIEGPLDGLDFVT